MVSHNALLCPAGEGRRAEGRTLAPPAVKVFSLLSSLQRDPKRRKSLCCCRSSSWPDRPGPPSPCWVSPRPLFPGGLRPDPLSPDPASAPLQVT